MSALIKYIVFFFFCFNIYTAQGAEVIFEPDEEDTSYNEPVSFAKALSLPHAADMPRILNDESNSPLGKLLILGKYFDEKYPDDSIKTDFSEDVGLIFPDLSRQEVYNRTVRIRQAVLLYRWGKKKYEDLKAGFLAPKEPPLIVDEKDYDEPGRYQYVPAEEGKFAILYDFKKVLSYGHNPRDIEARESRAQRLLDQKKNKTSYEKFKSMVAKLEISKIPFYGITEPNPFVGNAGIGTWLKKDGYKIRLISEIAEISSQAKFMAAIHVTVPGHRFILANDLGSALQKPSIEVIASENVKNYQIFYPLPIKVANASMVGAYAGDFAFPIAIETIDPEKPVKLQTKVTFNSCDERMQCDPMTFAPQLEINTGVENVNSSLQNFIRQSFYNLPPPESKNFKLEKAVVFANTQENPDNSLRLIFNFSGAIDNFAVFVEDAKGTIFSAPRISIDNNKIFVNVSPEGNLRLEPGNKVTVTARLNSYTRLRQEIEITQSEKNLGNTYNFSVKETVFYGFLAGLLLVFTPLGFLIFAYALVKTKNKENNLFSLISGIFIGVNLFALTLFYIQSSHISLFWGLQMQNIAYILTVMFGIVILLLNTEKQNLFTKIKGKVGGLITGLTLVLFIPYANAPRLDLAIGQSLSYTPFRLLMVFNALAVGAALPYLFLKIFFNAYAKKQSPKLYFFLKVVMLFMALIALMYLTAMIFFQVNWLSFIKIMFCFGCGWVLFVYMSRFLEALHRTKLSVTKQTTTEKTVVIMGLSLILVLSWIGSNIAPLQPTSPKTEPDIPLIEKEISQGKTVLVGINADWCLLCQYNNITTLNERILDRWENLYNFKYINVQDNAYNPLVIHYLRQHGRISPPLYVLYNLNLDEGLVLPNFLNSSSLEQTLQNFKI